MKYSTKQLIIGLGNIGKVYNNSRHNIGFKILDYIINNNNYTIIQYINNKFGKFYKILIKKKIFFLLKPNTYMNYSGKAILYFMKQENILISNILVISDDFNLKLGTLRIRKKGGDGGHQGLKNINEYLNSSCYSRLRFGIGNNFNKNQQSEYVLGKWNKDELNIINKKIITASQIIMNFIFYGIDFTMNNINK